MKKDKFIERDRYEERAKNVLKSKVVEEKNLGSEDISLYLREPYLKYENYIKKYIKPSYKVLEVGSGTGIHTYSILKTGAKVTATDISRSSTKIVNKKYRSFVEINKLETKIADIEDLPFSDESFDAITSAGSLSYGSRKLVDNEIYRVLKPGGKFICVDSLNNNLIYRANRFTGFILGKRSLMTIKNMLATSDINNLEKKYEEIKVRYYGSITFAIPFISKVIGKKKASYFSSYLDRKCNIKKSAFKFVLLAKK